MISLKSSKIPHFDSSSHSAILDWNWLLKPPPIYWGLGGKAAFKSRPTKMDKNGGEQVPHGNCACHLPIFQWRIQSHALKQINTLNSNAGVWFAGGRLTAPAIWVNLNLVWWHQANTKKLKKWSHWYLNSDFHQRQLNCSFPCQSRPSTTGQITAGPQKPVRCWGKHGSQWCCHIPSSRIASKVHVCDVWNLAVQEISKQKKTPPQQKYVQKQLV